MFQNDAFRKLFHNSEIINKCIYDLALPYILLVRGKLQKQVSDCQEYINEGYTAENTYYAFRIIIWLFPYHYN